MPASIFIGGQLEIEEIASRDAKPMGALMKVLHIISGLKIGGAELMLKRLIESHQGNPNYRYSVISLTPVGKVRAKFQEMSVEVRTLGKSNLNTEVAYV